jgi:Tfp pilus assembly protein PilE
MTVIRSACSRRFVGFTRIELLVIVTVLALVIGLVNPTIARAKAKSRRIGCVSRLKNMGLAYRIFATDNGDRFPWEIETNRVTNVQDADEIVHYFQVVSNALSTPIIIACPADTRKPAVNWASLTRQNISYFINVNSAETYPDSFLAGDRNLLTNGVNMGPGRVKMTQNSEIAWDPITQHKNQGNAVMGDSSVQQLSIPRLQDHWKKTATNDATFLFP